jgi:hypothetical protein
LEGAAGVNNRPDNSFEFDGAIDGKGVQEFQQFPVPKHCAGDSLDDGAPLPSQVRGPPPAEVRPPPRRSRIAHLPNPSRTDLTDKKDFVVVFQSIEIERLCEELGASRMRVREL